VELSVCYEHLQTRREHPGADHSASDGMSFWKKRSTVSFRNVLRACINANGGHFEHTL